MQGRDAVSETEDALYRACRRYEEMAVRRAANLDDAWDVLVNYYCQRIFEGDDLPPPPRDITEHEFGQPGNESVTLWTGKLMDEIDRRRKARGR